MIEWIYSGVRYLRKDRKLGECKGSSWRIWKEVLIGHKRCKIAKKRKKDI